MSLFLLFGDKVLAGPKLTASHKRGYWTGCVESSIVAFMHLEALSDAIHLPLRKSRRMCLRLACTRTWTGLDYGYREVKVMKMSRTREFLAALGIALILSIMIGMECPSGRSQAASSYCVSLQAAG